MTEQSTISFDNTEYAFVAKTNAELKKRSESTRLNSSHQ